VEAGAHPSKPEPVADSKVRAPPPKVPAEPKARPSNRVASAADVREAPKKLPAPAEAAEVDEARAEPKPSAAPKSGSGRLSLDTRPQTEVYLGQKSLGTTPLVGVELSPGHQVLQLVNEDKGISQSFEVDIRAGETTQKRLDLSP
jgi:eukaryotic-like serine/threonine-protein kinase